MGEKFTLEYWKEGGNYLGRLREMPGVSGEGGSLEELEENIKQAYLLMLDDEEVEHDVDESEVETKEIEI